MKFAVVAAAVAACFAGSALAATTVNVNFHQPHTLDITSHRLTTIDTGGFHVDTPYYDSLDLNLGAGLNLSITATAFKDGDPNKVLNDRVVYYSQVGAPLQAGLGVTSVSRGEGPLGTGYTWDNGRDGSIDIDSHKSLDNGHDALLLKFNQEVTLNKLTVFHYDDDDRAQVRVLAGDDLGQAFNITCHLCLPTHHHNSSLGFTGTEFLLQANDKIGALGVNWNSTEFRLAGLSLSYTPAVPEPETYAMLLAGLGLIGGVARRRRPQH